MHISSAVTIGFTATSYTNFEDEAQVCVSLQNGILAIGTTANYRIRTTNIGKFSNLGTEINLPLVKGGLLMEVRIRGHKLLLFILNFS